MTDLDSYLPAIAAGDPGAFARWVAGCEHRLRGSLSPFSGGVDSEAVLQETLLRIWQVAPRFEPDGRPDALVRFAVRVARNTAISELRRLSVPERLVAELAAAPSAEQVVEPDPLLRERVAECRQSLPDKPRLALEQRLASAGSRSDAELARLVGMRLNTFVQNLVRARRLLAACLERHGIAVEGLAK